MNFPGTLLSCFLNVEKTQAASVFFKLLGYVFAPNMKLLVLPQTQNFYIQSDGPTLISYDWFTVQSSEKT
jgi:hypothetical protein